MVNGFGHSKYLNAFLTENSPLSSNMMRMMGYFISLSASIGERTHDDQQKEKSTWYGHRAVCSPLKRAHAPPQPENR
jgi:hypothetical protein